jgi:hypothetical protein
MLNIALLTVTMLNVITLIAFVMSVIMYVNCILILNVNTLSVVC